MRWQSMLVFVLLFGTVVSASVRYPSSQKKDSPESWVDPATGLIWAGKDNGQDINWRKATKYCRDLRLGGYADWRLATIEELEGIYDSMANAPGLGAGKDGKGATTWHVKGNLFLTGYQWSSTRVLHNDGRPSDLVWYFDFWNKNKGKDDGSWFSGRVSTSNRRALCVRSAGK